MIEQDDQKFFMIVCGDVSHNLWCSAEAGGSVRRLKYSPEQMKFQPSRASEWFCKYKNVFELLFLSIN